jgi:hypothetical protein
VQFLAFLKELPQLAVAPFDEDELATASQVVKKFAYQKLTMADAHGLALMKERRITSCWSTDRHLGLMGVPIVIQA